MASSPGKKTFVKGDRVFAKLRGYAPWPARVEDIASKSPYPKKMRYNILFYGTYEVATCTGDQLFDFDKHKNKFGSAKTKVKGFQEAMVEIVDNPNVVPPARQESSDEDESESQEAGETASASKSSKKRPEAFGPKDEEIAKKKMKKTTETKAGLKVAFPGFKTKPRTNEVKPGSEPIEHDVSDDDDNDVVSIKMSYTQIHQLLNNDTLPPGLKAKLEAAVAMRKPLNGAKIEDVQDTRSLLMTEAILKGYTNELVQLIEAPKLPNHQQMIDILDKLLATKIDPVILKKQASVIETVHKLQEYMDCHNSENSEETTHQRESVENTALTIRQKATQLMEIFMSSFDIPDGTMFLPWIMEESKMLTSVTSKEDLILLTKEPTLVNLDNSSPSE